MSVVATAAGTGAIGFATELSETKGTTKKALTVLGGVAATGGLVGWYQDLGTGSVAIGSLSIGFIVGLVIGVLLGQSACCASCLQENRSECDVLAAR